MSRILWAFVGACVVTVGLSAQSDPQGQGGAPTTPDRQPPTTQAPPAAAAGRCSSTVPVISTL